MSGCGCSGSTRNTATPARQEKAVAAPKREPRRGGPGEPGYYFTGPKSRKAPQGA